MDNELKSFAESMYSALEEKGMDRKEAEDFVNSSLAEADTFSEVMAKTQAKTYELMGEFSERMTHNYPNLKEAFDTVKENLKAEFPSMTDKVAEDLANERIFESCKKYGIDVESYFDVSKLCEVVTEGKQIPKDEIVDEHMQELASLGAEYGIEPEDIHILPEEITASTLTDMAIDSIVKNDFSMYNEEIQEAVKTSLQIIVDNGMTPDEAKNKIYAFIGEEADELAERLEDNREPIGSDEFASDIIDKAIEFVNFGQEMGYEMPEPDFDTEYDIEYDIMD